MPGYHFVPTTTSKTTARRRARKADVEQRMSKTGCVRCLTKDAAMVLDHFGEGVSAKEAGVMALIDKDASVARVEAELEKVRVVCLDCHFYRTWTQQVGVPLWAFESRAADRAFYLNAKALMADGFDLVWG